jgi:N-acetylglucosaminyl-diphospho-decaprenol L-rhamnosyltransferase
MTLSTSQTTPTSPSAAQLIIVIVAYKLAPMTLDCLASIEPELASLPPTQVWVVDNDSPDGAGQQVADGIKARGWHHWAELIQSPGNNGFAAGNNVAFRRALAQEPQAPFLLMLNPDTLVRPGALRLLLDFVQARPEVGMAGGRSEDRDTTPQVCAFRFPSLLSEVLLHTGLGILDRIFAGHLTSIGIPEQPARVDWVSGAFVLMRRQVLEQLGLMDDGFFLYFEETDYMHRAHKAGLQCWHVPSSRVVHLVGQSSGVTERKVAPRRLPPYWFESRRRYFVRHQGRAYTAFMDLCLALIIPVTRLRHSLQGKTGSTAPYFVRDLLRHSALWRGDSVGTTASATNATN